MPEVSVSVLNVKEENATHMFYELEVAKTDYFHIDVMDGKFVENDTTKRMKDYSLTLSHMTNIGLDVHLMVEDIEEHIDSYLDLNPEYLAFHIEASKDKERTLKNINTIKSNGIKAGIAINPDTPIEGILEYLPLIHLVIVMTVVPGKGGQKLIPETVEKIKKLREYIDENDLGVFIEADGGINNDTANLVKEAGVDILVSGSYLVNSEDKLEAIKGLKN